MIEGIAFSMFIVLIVFAFAYLDTRGNDGMDE